jgi:hypothetical protein
MENIHLVPSIHSAPQRPLPQFQDLRNVRPEQGAGFQMPSDTRHSQVHQPENQLKTVQEYQADLDTLAIQIKLVQALDILRSDSKNLNARADLDNLLVNNESRSEVMKYMRSTTIPEHKTILQARSSVVFPHLLANDVHTKFFHNGNFDVNTAEGASNRKVLETHHPQLAQQLDMRPINQLTTDMHGTVPELLLTPADNNQYLHSPYTTPAHSQRTTPNLSPQIQSQETPFDLFHLGDLNLNSAGHSPQISPTFNNLYLNPAYEGSQISLQSEPIYQNDHMNFKLGSYAQDDSNIHQQFASPNANLQFYSAGHTPQFLPEQNNTSMPNFFLG